MRVTMTPPDSVLTTPVQIVLLGFMGAGKSTVGPLLADILNWQFLDADEVLERREGCTIAELFARAGEEDFRRLEESTIAELLTLDGTVIALGGGAIESASTRSLLASRHDLFTAFLEGPLEILLERCNQSQTVRPLLQNREQVEPRYAKRLPHYRLATITVSTEGLTPQMIAHEISRQLSERMAKLEAQYSKDRSQ
jgi:shikimate kinase